MPLISSKRVWTRQPQNLLSVDYSKDISAGIQIVFNAATVTSDTRFSISNLSIGVASGGRSAFATDDSTSPCTANETLGANRSIVVLANIKTISGAFPVVFADRIGGNGANWLGAGTSGWTIGGAAVSGSGALIYNTDQCIISTSEGDTNHKIYVDGVLKGSGSSSLPVNPGMIFCGYGIGGVATSLEATHGSVYLIIVYSRVLSQKDIYSLSTNPWQVFKKQDGRIWIPSAGGGLSLTGSLTGQGSTLSASATNTEVHAISGTLVGAGATLSGTATRIYSLTGSLTGQGATLSGSATTLESHAATGALIGAGSTLSATATNTEIHAATGALVGSGATLSGAATHTPLGINASGSLVGQGATLSATATNTEVHTCTGSLYGQGATLSGALTRVFSASGSLVGAGSTLSATAGNAVAVFSATGSLVGQGSTLTGSATNTETHAVSGSLAGQGATLSATAALANLHTLSGSLVGSGSSLVGYASGPTTAFEASPDAIVTVINKRNRVSVISRRS